MKIGILNVQGAITEHQAVCLRNGHDVILVRTESDLADIDGLILPGGESTVMRRLIDAKPTFKEALLNYCHNRPVYATCAGVILLSQEYLGVLDVNVIRNGFGSQIASEVVELKWNDVTQQAAFIRAPIIDKCSDQSFMTEAYYRQQLVGLETDKIIALSFHPELTDNDQLFNYFIKSKVAPSL